MNSESTPVANALPPATGRGWLWLGAALCVLPIAAYAVQFGVLQRMFVPWYIPILTTAGAALMCIAVRRRRTWQRVAMFVFVLAFAGFEWFAMTAAVRLPKYTGPAKAGAHFPSFTTQASDGREITERDLQQGKATVLVFYRGRW